MFYHGPWAGVILGFVDYAPQKRMTGHGLETNTCDVGYSLNSLKGGYIGDYIGDYYRGY